MILGLSLMHLILSPESFQFEESEKYVPINKQISENAIVDGVHLDTGLVEGEGLTEVVNNCTNCHSAKLITQNRMNRERWNATIRWMQETQNLWDLGENQKKIVDYLVNNYPVEEIGRRANLTNIDWYELKD